MTLDEAIEHAKEVARTCDDPQCAADHLQLAEWLRQTRGADKGARWLTGKLHELNDENTGLFMENGKLRELVRDTWRLFVVHGAVSPCDLPEVDAVRNRIRELGIEVKDE